MNKCPTCNRRLSKNSPVRMPMNAAGVGDYYHEGPSGVMPTLESQVMVPLSKSLVWASIGAGWGWWISSLVDSLSWLPTVVFCGLASVSLVWFFESRFYAQLTIRVEDFTGADIFDNGYTPEPEMVDDIVPTNEGHKRVSTSYFENQTGVTVSRVDIKVLARAHLHQGLHLSRRKLSAHPSITTEKATALIDFLVNQKLASKAHDNARAYLAPHGYIWLFNKLHESYQDKVKTQDFLGVREL